MNSRVTITNHIEVTPGTCGGKPRIAGSRIRVQDIVLWTEQGQSVDQIITDYPQLTHGDVYAALTYYHDNRPLIESEHILITAMAQVKQHGTVYNEDGTKLIETGGPPLLLEPVQATLTFKGKPVSSVKSVDVYGVPKNTQIECSVNTFEIDGRYATYYYEVKR